MTKPIHLFLLAALALLQSQVSEQTTNQVSVTNNRSTPQGLTVSVGDIVEWTNTEGYHNVNGSIGTFSSNPESFGNALGAGWNFSYTFNSVLDRYFRSSKRYLPVADKNRNGTAIGKTVQRKLIVVSG